MDAQIKRARYLSSKEFSVLFAQTVHIFPSIWNRSLRENRSLIVVNVAWEKIASILGNGLTAKQCQQKWRTMRNNYTAQLRKAARNGTDLVFLNGAMDFVRPYTISGLAYPAGNGNDSSSDCEVVEEEEETVVSSDVNKLVELPEVTTTTTSGDGKDPLGNDYDDAPAACQHIQIDSSDGDALFLLSVLPEMEAMNEEQKRAFKNTVQALVKQFLD
ncbi:uncharacterized protein LOC120416440 [Culex pipiens pallens]|uniref:uncharacterized protein LOC120416440 n=1 Tax=Culex pipiens pallens TaxID=42434 RepID=UPI0022AA509A|nr:uncharacterized protein LOC120416440 [Culex pipiens pallens]